MKNRYSRTMLSTGTVAVLIALNAPVLGGGMNASLVGQWDGFSGSYADVWADGDFAYIAHFGSAEVDIVDISNPANPVHVQQYVLPPPNTGASAQDVKVGDGLLFIGLEGGGNSVHIVDVRDPTNPIALVDIAISGFTAIHNVFYHNGYLYIADSGSPRIDIVDLTAFDPDNPPGSPITSVKWSLTGVGTSFVHDMTVVGDRMYACAWDSGIWIFDVGNIANEPPQFLGSGPGNNTHSCWPTVDGRFVITGEERNGGGITVYKITENEDSTVTLEITDAKAVPTSEAFSVHNQATIGYRVFNAWYGAGLRVYDLDPVDGMLTLVASYAPPILDDAWGIYPFLGPDKVVVSDIANGLFLLSVTAELPPDCNENGVPDAGDILFGTSIDDNGNGIPDECESPALPDPPVVSAVGPRYVQVAAAPGTDPVALLFTSPDEPCVSLFVQAPATINDRIIGRLDVKPVFLAPDEWGTVFVGDDVIIPDTAYSVQAVAESNDVSDAAAAVTWTWGDTNNSGGATDFDDIVCVLDGFGGAFFGDCGFFAADLEAAVPNVVIDFDDVLAAIDAFSGATYLGNPLHPDPCP